MKKGLLHGTYSSKIHYNSFLLDEYNGAACAYSFRKLRNDYSGPCVKVRRISDNVTKDIGFSIDNFGNGIYYDWNDALIFKGSSNLTIDTIYDQSGNNNHLTQSNTLLQPSLSSDTQSAGSNRRPHFNVNNFIGCPFEESGAASGKRMINSTISISNPFTYFITLRHISVLETGAGVFFDSYNNTQCAFYYSGTAEIPNNQYSSASGTSAIRGGIPTPQITLFSGTMSNNSTIYKNGDLITSGSIGSNGLNGLSVGALRGNPNPLLNNYFGYFVLFEFVIYPGLINYKTQVEANIKKYYRFESNNLGF
jgi:hypothetical protein